MALVGVPGNVLEMTSRGHRSVVDEESSEGIGDSLLLDVYELPTRHSKVRWVTSWRELIPFEDIRSRQRSM